MAAMSDPTRPGWSGSFMKAWKGEFSRGVRQKEPAPEVRITTSAYDADRDKLELLGPLTPNEARLFRQGGFTAVIEDRRFYAREKGDPTWAQIGVTSYGTQAEQRPLQEKRPPDQPQGPTTGKQEQEGGVRVPLSILSSGDRTNPGEASGQARRDQASSAPEAKLNKLSHYQGVRSGPYRKGNDPTRNVYGRRPG